jgi:NADPH:quinone reductase-like Zn-dependent oxidoreductase
MMPVVVVVFIVALAAGADSQQLAPAPAPAPAAAAGGCTVLLAKVADCLQYITPGSAVSQPTEKCCTEVRSGLKDAAAVACVCNLLGGQTFGLSLNLTRAAGLPVACGAPASSLDQCTAITTVGTYYCSNLQYQLQFLDHSCFNFLIIID